MGSIHDLFGPLGSRTYKIFPEARCSAKVRHLLGIAGKTLEKI
jgi:hypothetical protein